MQMNSNGIHNLILCYRIRSITPVHTLLNMFKSITKIILKKQQKDNDAAEFFARPNGSGRFSNKNN